jgi:hypothetical protein
MRIDRRGLLQTGVALAASAAGAKHGVGQAFGQSNCFVESGANAQVVNSMTALANAVNSAPAGRQILIQPGTYTGGAITFNRDGIEDNPIVIRPQGALGSVTIDMARWTLANTSSWLVFSELYLTRSRIQMMGDHNRVSRCRFRNINIDSFLIGNPDASAQGARDCRIDHCDFADLQGTTSSPIQLRANGVLSGSTRRVLIDYCYFHDLNPTSTTSGGREWIATSVANVTIPRGQTMTIDHCFFSNIHIPGENESFTIKQHGWIVRFCTFINVGEELTFRTTNDTEVRSCWFENTPTRTIRCFGENHLIIGNRVVGAGDFIIACGNATMAEILSGAEPIDSYARTRNCRIIGNTMGSGRIIVGGYNQSQTPGNPIEYPALNNILQANTRTSGPPAHTLVNTILGFSPAQTGTTVSGTTSASFVRAVRLTSANVGLNAPDPLCN